jgi:hypothetical protein
MTDKKNFSRRLQNSTFGRYNSFELLGWAGALAGFGLVMLDSPIGVSLAAPGFFLAAREVRQRGRAPNVATDSEGFPDLTTREYEDLSHEGHARNARRVGNKMISLGLVAILIDVGRLVLR